MSKQIAAGSEGVIADEQVEQGGAMSPEARAKVEAVVTFFLLQAEGKQAALDVVDGELQCRFSKDMHTHQRGLGAPGQPEQGAVRIAETAGGQVIPFEDELKAMARIGEERRAVVEEAFQLYAQIVAPDLVNGRYTGKVTHISDNGYFFVQYVGGNRAVLHEAEHMEKGVRLNEVVSIRYRDGKAMPTAKSHDIGLSQGR